jgi:methylenetetrahydrofolate--tRNA-(uracil-5-)-methyltransferase
MRRCGSLIIRAADNNKVPAGSALAVDRDAFAAEVTRHLREHPLITIRNGEVTGLPAAEQGLAIIASGPLTSSALATAIADATGEDGLAFFDAIAPIIYKESIDFDVCWFQSRYDKPGPGGGTADYINCPLDEAQYNAFITALITGEKTEFRDWEKNTPYFEGCLPIEVMAERGPQTLRFGPLKPVGLTNPHNPAVKPHAIVQLRQDNALSTLYNMVGFQTKLKHGAQKEIFRTIPGLEKAEFARLGGIHRNTYLNSPVLLDSSLRLETAPHLRFAGQITGVEGYVESAASGLLAGLFTSAEYLDHDAGPPPATTALGALIAHISGGFISESGKNSRFQPMNVNFGLFPPINAPIVTDGKRPRRKADRARLRKQALSSRALGDLDQWLARQQAN